MSNMSPLLAFRTAAGLTLASLGERLGVGAPAIWKWERRGVPPERVLDVERVTGISRHELRPDVFGSAPLADAAQ